MTKWTCEQSVKMYHIKPEDREDDTFLTPRSNQSKSERFSASSGTKLLADKGNVTKFDHYVKNADNVLFQRDYEENEPVSFKFRIQNYIFSFVLTSILPLLYLTICLITFYSHLQVMTQTILRWSVKTANFSIRISFTTKRKFKEKKKQETPNSRKTFLVF